MGMGASHPRPCSAALMGCLVLQAHIYSLGATLKAALEYVAEPEQEPRLSRDLEALLGQMQAEDPGDRPDLEVHSPLTSAQCLRAHAHTQHTRRALLPHHHCLHHMAPHL